MRSPVVGIAANPQYLDITVPAGVRLWFTVDTYRQTFAYVFEGASSFVAASDPKDVLIEKSVCNDELNIQDMSGNRTLVQFGSGDEVVVQASLDGVRFLLVSGAPAQEPVAWHEPIKMNTQEEIRQAIQDLHNDRFIKAH